MVNNSTNINQTNNYLSPLKTKKVINIQYVDGNPAPGLGQA
jgi:hypothetical protein